MLYALSDGDLVKAKEIAEQPAEEVLEWLEIGRTRADVEKKLREIKIHG